MAQHIENKPGTSLSRDWPISLVGNFASYNCKLIICRLF